MRRNAPATRRCGTPVGFLVLIGNDSRTLQHTAVCVIVRLGIIAGVCWVVLLVALPGAVVGAARDVVCGADGVAGQFVFTPVPRSVNEREIVAVVESRFGGIVVGGDIAVEEDV